LDGWVQGSALIDSLPWEQKFPFFLKDEISSDTTDLEQEMLNPTFLCELAFLTDNTKHMNDLNMKLQGKQQNVSNLSGQVNCFRDNWSCSKQSLRETTSLTFPAVKN
jgi:hypothetical protein